MQCCSCGKYEVSSLRLAALRQSAASCRGCNDVLKVDARRAPASAFAVYCRCTKQRLLSVTSTDATSFSPPAAATDLMAIRWRYWSLMCYQQIFQDLENSTWMNYRYLYQQQQKQQRHLVIRRLPQPVRGKPASVSTTSARQFSCRSCSYSTDRKNNLKRHVTTMHRCPDYAVMTSSGGNYDGAKISTAQRGVQSRDQPDKTHR